MISIITFAFNRRMSSLHFSVKVAFDPQSDRESNEVFYKSYASLFFLSLAFLESRSLTEARTIICGNCISLSIIIPRFWSVLHHHTPRVDVFNSQAVHQSGHVCVGFLMSGSYCCSTSCRCECVCSFMSR